jgi:hypothetical protein
VKTFFGFFSRNISKTQTRKKVQSDPSLKPDRNFKVTNSGNILWDFWKKINQGILPRAHARACVGGCRCVQWGGAGNTAFSSIIDAFSIINFWDFKKQTGLILFRIIICWNFEKEGKMLFPAPPHCTPFARLDAVAPCAAEWAFNGAERSGARGDGARWWCEMMVVR